MEVLFPSIFADKVLKPKIEDPSFFNRSGLSEDFLVKVNSLLLLQTIPDSYKEILHPIEISPISQDVKSAIKDLLACKYLSQVLEDNSGQSEKIYSTIATIQQSEFNKEFVYELAWSKLCNEINETENLEDLIKYIPIANNLDSTKKESVEDSLFIKISSLADIGCEKLIELAQQILIISKFSSMSSVSLIFNTLCQEFISKLKQNEVIQSIPNDLRSMVEEESAENIKRALFLLKDVQFEPDFEADFSYFKSLYRLEEEFKEENKEENKNNELAIDKALVTISDNKTINDFSETLNNLPVKSWDQIQKIREIFEIKTYEKELKVFECNVLINQELKNVAVKCNYTKFRDESLTNQAVIMSKVQDHKNFLKLYGAFWENYNQGFRFTLVMELAKETLNDRILNWEEKKVDKIEREKEALYAAPELVNAMYHLNSKDISHRDIKPHNIFITEDGTYKIADFDISLKFERNLSGVTVTNVNASLAGTMLYLSPEIRDLEFKSKGSTARINYNKSDVYSLGLTILRMITDRSTKLNILIKNLQNEVYCVVDEEVTHPKLNMIIKKMLTVDLDKRPKFEELVQEMNKEEQTFIYSD